MLRDGQLPAAEAAGVAGDDLLDQRRAGSGHPHDEHGSVAVSRARRDVGVGLRRPGRDRAIDHGPEGGTIPSNRVEPVRGGERVERAVVLSQRLVQSADLEEQALTFQGVQLGPLDTAERGAEALLRPSEGHAEFGVDGDRLGRGAAAGRRRSKEREGLLMLAHRTHDPRKPRDRAVEIPVQPDGPLEGLSRLAQHAHVALDGGEHDEPIGRHRVEPDGAFEMVKRLRELADLVEGQAEALMGVGVARLCLDRRLKEVDRGLHLALGVEPAGLLGQFCGCGHRALRREVRDRGVDQAYSPRWRRLSKSVQNEG